VSGFLQLRGGGAGRATGLAAGSGGTWRQGSFVGLGRNKGGEGGEDGGEFTSRLPCHYYLAEAVKTVTTQFQLQHPNKHFSKPTASPRDCRDAFQPGSLIEHLRMMREVALMGLFLGVPQTSSHLGLNPLLVLGWIRNLGLDPLFRDIINTLVEGVNAAGVDKIAGEFRLSQETLRRVIAFAKRERQRREQENVPSSVTSLRLTQDFSRPELRRVCLILCSPAQCRRFSAANPPELRTSLPTCTYIKTTV